jgi:hypothetical protein
MADIVLVRLVIVLVLETVVMDPSESRLVICYSIIWPWLRNRSRID